MSRWRLVMLGLATLAAVLVLVPRTFWWTGRMPAAPMDLVAGGPEVDPVGRLWIDSDTACGAGPRTDPDDCFAALWLVGRGMEIVGLSTSFGNSPGEVVQSRIAALAGQMRRAALTVPKVHIGFAAPEVGSETSAAEPDAVAALRRALEAGPLTVLALGPLTNLAATLEGRPDLLANVQRVVAVMGHQEGHLFHPSEGNGRGVVLGHGPIFRDLNARVDIAAVRAVLALGVPITLVPYDAGRGAVISGADLERYARTGPAQAWLAGQAQGWLGFWQDEVGTKGFYPFDWVAAGYLVAPWLFDCATVRAEVRREWALWLFPHDGLVVSPDSEGTVLYCPRVGAGLHDLLLTP
jgi:purine nucleosidase